jgi:hypothetical protein
MRLVMYVSLPAKPVPTECASIAMCKTAVAPVREL